MALSIRRIGATQRNRGIARAHGQGRDRNRDPFPEANLQFVWNTCNSLARDQEQLQAERQWISKVRSLHPR